MEPNKQFDIIDILGVVSFYISFMNLIENRQQTKDNDINVANDKQARFLLDEINKKFDKIENEITQLKEMMETR